LLKVTTKKGRKIGGDMVATKKGCQKIEGKFLPFRGGGESGSFRLVPAQTV